MAADALIVSSFFSPYKGKMKHANLDRYIIAAHYCVMKHEFGIENVLEGEVGIFFCLSFMNFSFRKEL
jgi:hypothetical protein